MKSLPPVLMLALCGLLTLMTRTFAEDEALPVRRPSVGFFGHFPAPSGPEIAGRLQADGFDLRRGADFKSAPITWDQVKRYDVLVVIGLGGSAGDGSLTEENRKNIEVLNRFMEAGGGVLFIPFWYQQDRFFGPMKAFLNPLGLDPLLMHVINDPNAVKGVTAWNLDFGYTEDLLTDSPITEGAKEVWLPVNLRTGVQQTSTPFVADDSWKIIVRAGEHSVAEAYDMAMRALPEQPIKRPPLLATRQVGKGRLVFFGIASPQFLLDPIAAATLEWITFEKGLNGKPSSGYVLLRNSLKWLAQPALENPELGGTGMDKSLLADPTKTVFIKPFDWRKEREPKPLDDWSGVIGARTSYSSGQATPDECVEAAKAAGLNFLVFLEDFAKLDEAKFQKLNSDCLRLTTPDFAAIPGFTIEDEAGYHYFYFGTEVKYPKKEIIDPEKKRLRAYDPGYNRQAPYIPGHLSMTTLDYVYTYGAHRLTAGNFLYSAAPFPVFFANAGAAGVVTRKNGKLVESKPEVLMELAAMGKSPVPVVVDLMDDPSYLKTTPWRTELRLPKGSDGTNPVVEWSNTWKGIFPNNPSTPSISSGPKIVLWATSGPRDYAGGLKGDFVTSDYRWRVHGIVEAAAGLKEVRIYDGPRLFRRFLPKGEPKFSFDIDLTHDRQHTLLLQVTDQNGGVAYSGDLIDRNHRLMEFSCSDQNNQLSYSFITDSNGHTINLGGNQPLSTPNLRVDPKQISPSGTFGNDKRLGTAAFDGTVGGAPTVYAPVAMVAENGLIPSPGLSRSERLLHTGDVAIGQGTWAHNFTDKVEALNVWRSLWMTEPARDFKVRKRNSFFQVDPDSPLAVFLWEFDIEILRDLPNRGFNLANIDPRDARIWAIRGGDALRVGTWEGPADVASPRREVEADLAIGDYVAALDSPLGGSAVFALSKGLLAKTSLPGKNRLELILSPGATPSKKGESAKASLLLLGIPRPVVGVSDKLPAGSTEVVERFRKEFGLAGKPTGYSVQVEAGKISSQVYILTVDGTKSRAFSGRLEGRPMSALPIRVTGLNDGWSACLFDSKEFKSRPLGVFESSAWATVPVHGRVDLFVGHPVICDKEELFIQATPMDQSSWRVEMHNPTDAEITTTAQVNPSLLNRMSADLVSKELVIPAGASVIWNFKSVRPELAE